MTDQWRRDATAEIRCACGHSGTEHRTDLQATSPCYRGGCGCQHLRPVARLWREHRVVEEVLLPED